MLKIKYDKIPEILTDEEFIKKFRENYFRVKQRAKDEGLPEKIADSIALSVLAMKISDLKNWNDRMRRGEIQNPTLELLEFYHEYRGYLLKLTKILIPEIE